MSEAACTAFCFADGVRQAKGCLLIPRENGLCDTVAVINGIGLLSPVDQWNIPFAAIIAVDSTDTIDKTDPMFDG